MATTITADQCADALASRALAVKHTRGDTLTIPLRIDGTRSAGHLALVDELETGAEWAGQIRLDGAVVASFTVTSSRDGDVLTVVFTADVDDLEAGVLYRFDFEATAIKWTPAGGTIWIADDVTREEGS